MVIKSVFYIFLAFAIVANVFAQSYGKPSVVIQTSAPSPAVPQSYGNPSVVMQTSVPSPAVQAVRETQVTKDADKVTTETVPGTKLNITTIIGRSNTSVTDKAVAVPQPAVVSVLPVQFDAETGVVSMSERSNSSMKSNGATTFTPIIDASQMSSETAREVNALGLSSNVKMADDVDANIAKQGDNNDVHRVDRITDTKTVQLSMPGADGKIIRTNMIDVNISDVTTDTKEAQTSTATTPIRHVVSNLAENLVKDGKVGENDTIILSVGDDKVSVSAQASNSTHFGKLDTKNSTLEDIKLLSDALNKQPSNAYSSPMAQLVGGRLNSSINSPDSSLSGSWVNMGQLVSENNADQQKEHYQGQPSSSDKNHDTSYFSSLLDKLTDSTPASPLSQNERVPDEVFMVASVQTPAPAVLITVPKSASAQNNQGLADSSKGSGGMPSLHQFEDASGSVGSPVSVLTYVTPSATGSNSQSKSVAGLVGAEQTSNVQNGNSPGITNGVALNSYSSGPTGAKQDSQGEVVALLTNGQVPLNSADILQLITSQLNASISQGSSASNAPSNATRSGAINTSMPSGPRLEASAFSGSQLNDVRMVSQTSGALDTVWMGTTSGPSSTAGTSSRPQGSAPSQSAGSLSASQISGSAPASQTSGSSFACQGSACASQISNTAGSMSTSQGPGSFASTSQTSSPTLLSQGGTGNMSGSQGLGASQMFATGGSMSGSQGLGGASAFQMSGTGGSMSASQGLGGASASQISGTGGSMSASQGLGVASASQMSGTGGSMSASQGSGSTSASQMSGTGGSMSASQGSGSASASQMSGTGGSMSASQGSGSASASQMSGTGGSMSASQGSGSASASQMSGTGGNMSASQGLGGASTSQMSGNGSSMSASQGLGGASASQMFGTGGSMSASQGLGGASASQLFGTGGSMSASQGLGGASASQMFGTGGSMSASQGLGGAPASQMFGTGGSMSASQGLGGASASQVSGTGGSMSVSQGLGGASASQMFGAGGSMSAAQGSGNASASQISGVTSGSQTSGNPVPQSAGSNTPSSQWVGTTSSGFSFNSTKAADNIAGATTTSQLVGSSNISSVTLTATITQNSSLGSNNTGAFNNATGTPMSSQVVNESTQSSQAPIAFNSTKSLSTSQAQMNSSLTSVPLSLNLNGRRNMSSHDMHDSPFLAHSNGEHVLRSSVSESDIDQWIANAEKANINVSLLQIATRDQIAWTIWASRSTGDSNKSTTRPSAGFCRNVAVPATNTLALPHFNAVNSDGFIWILFSKQVVEVVSLLEQSSITGVIYKDGSLSTSGTSVTVVASELHGPIFGEIDQFAIDAKIVNSTLTPERGSTEDKLMGQAEFRNVMFDSPRVPLDSAKQESVSPSEYQITYSFPEETENNDQSDFSLLPENDVSGYRKNTGKNGGFVPVRGFAPSSGIGFNTRASNDLSSSPYSRANADSISVSATTADKPSDSPFRRRTGSSRSDGRIGLY